MCDNSKYKIGHLVEMYPLSNSGYDSKRRIKDVITKYDDLGNIYFLYKIGGKLWDENGNCVSNENYLYSINFNPEEEEDKEYIVKEFKSQELLTEENKKYIIDYIKIFNSKNNKNVIINFMTEKFEVVDKKTLNILKYKTYDSYFTIDIEAGIKTSKFKITELFVCDTDIKNILGNILEEILNEKEIKALYLYSIESYKAFNAGLFSDEIRYKISYTTL